MNATTIISYLEVWWFWIDWGAFALAVLSIPSVLIQRRGRPTAALSWILALTSLPMLGLLLWWLFGRRHLERRRRRKRHAHAAVTERLETLREELDDAPSSEVAALPFHSLPTELADSVFEPSSGNAVELLDSHDAFDVMERDIRNAKRHVHALFYIWKNDDTGRRFCDALIEKAKEGKEVRVLCDAIGSPIMATKFSWPLRKAGVKVARFLPPKWLSAAPRVNFRNHRKILVVDGTIGVIGGFNIGDEYRKTWRDMGIRIDGPAVDQLQEIFADDWYYATHEDLVEQDYFGQWSETHEPGAACATIASGPDSRYSPIHDAIFVAINQCKRRLYVMTPYFIPTRALQAALRAAVYRGVDVRILLPAKSDVMLVRYAARSYYADLLELGVRIYEYQPAMLHAKVTVFDDELVLVGSANLDSRSFRLNFEASTFVASRELNEEITNRFLSDLERSEEIDLVELQARHWASKLRDATAHLMSPLL
jgi:cardiolipin synthase